MKQYEIWWAVLPEPVGRRPVLLLSRDSAYPVLSRILVVEITTRVRGIPVEVELGSAEGLPQRSIVNLDNLHAVPKGALRERVGRLGPARVAHIKRALGWALAWPELKETSGND